MTFAGRMGHHLALMGVLRSDTVMPGIAGGELPCPRHVGTGHMSASASVRIA